MLPASQKESNSEKVIRKSSIGTLESKPLLREDGASDRYSTISYNENQQQPLQQHQQTLRKPTRRDHIHYLSTLFAGVGSGALSSFVCAPLDLIRTRMQVWGDIQRQQQQSSRDRGKNLMGTNGVHTNGRIIDGPAKAFREILKKEGPRGMFRGLGATLVTVPLFWGVYFPLYDEAKDFLIHRQDLLDVRDYHPGVVHCISAIATGAVADLICNPFFVVRTRLQTQALHELTTTASSSASSSKGSGHRVSMIQMARRLKEELGMRVFWRGMTANLIGLSHCAVQFPAYEFLKAHFREGGSLRSENFGTDNTVLELLLASGLAKMAACLLTYPHEVLRSRMVDNRLLESPSLTGTVRQISRREGFRGFYNGLGVTLVRVVPNCCVTFLSYELLLKRSKEYFGE